MATAGSPGKTYNRPNATIDTISKTGTMLSMRRRMYWLTEAAYSRRRRREPPRNTARGEARPAIVTERDHVDANREAACVLRHKVVGLGRAAAIDLNSAARQILDRRRLGHWRRPERR